MLNYIYYCIHTTSIAPYINVQFWYALKLQIEYLLLNCSFGVCEYIHIRLIPQTFVHYWAKSYIGELTSQKELINSYKTFFVFNNWQCQIQCFHNIQNT